MKNYIFFFVIILLMLIKISIFSQELPYPIIFIHGLNSSNKTWDTTITKLKDMYGLKFSNNNIFYACLNAYKDMSKLEGPDGILGTIDDDVIIGATALTKSDIYVVNFDTWWNENPNSPLIYLNTDFYDVSIGESKSNQSSIVKQGYALGRFIKEIINQT